MARCRDLGIHFTCCPSTSGITSPWKDIAAPDHAIRQMIKAGLKALGAHGEAVTRHNRVFEALLGIDPSAPKRPVKDLFKLPSFEDLFDDRVARALERLGMTQALAELRERLDAIDARVQRLERQARTPRASKR